MLCTSSHVDDFYIHPLDTRTRRNVTRKVFYARKKRVSVFVAECSSEALTCDSIIAVFCGLVPVILLFLAFRLYIRVLWLQRYDLMKYHGTSQPFSEHLRQADLSMLALRVVTARLVILSGSLTSEI